MKRQVIIKQYENGIWWIHDSVDDTQIDGDRRKYVVIDMCKRWNFEIIKWIKYIG